MIGSSIHSRRFGFSLIEVLTIMFALAVALSLGATLLVTAMRADQVGAANLRELQRRSGLADQFREDVARSKEAPAQLGAWQAGESCIILKISDDLSIVYQWQNGQLDRIEQFAERENRRPIPVGSEFLRVEFRRSTSDPALVTLRLIEAPPYGVARTTDISACLGGDVR